ncbi:MAG TPA: SprB repeat-containing protein, partial [Sphingobacteriaceae bacterium]
MKIFLFFIFSLFNLQNLQAQCNGFALGTFDSANLGAQSSFSGWTPANDGDQLNVVYSAQTNSRGLQIKNTLKYSAKQTIYNLKPDTTYKISFTYYTWDGSDCSPANSALQIEVWNGAVQVLGSPFSISANSGASTTSSFSFPTASVLADYTIKIVDPGSNKPSCGAFVDNIYIESPLSANSSVTNVSCNGLNDGGFTINAYGAARPYTGTYSKDGGPLVPFTFTDGSATVSNLSAGTYSVTVTDVNGCVQTVPPFSITQPTSLSLSFTKTKDVSCFGGSDGAATLNVSGGTAPYSYSWTKDGVTITNPDLSALAAGAYEVTVTGAGNCSSLTANISITQPAEALLVNNTQTNISCQGENNGSFTVNVTGGTAPYNYTLNGATTPTGTFTGLVPGDYTVTVTDNNGCTAVTVATVIANPLPAIFSVTGGGAYCSGASGVLVGLSGSETGINYQLLNNGVSVGSAVAATGSAINFGLQTAAGTYTVSATNTTTGCSVPMAGSAVITINALPSIFSITGGGIYCADSGGAPVGLSGSETGVNYQLQNGGVNTGSVVAGTGSAISFGLQPAAGTYTIIATNAALCSVAMTGDVTITPSTPISGTAVITQAYT